MANMAELFGWQLHGPSVEFTGVATDTRSLLPGQLFVALCGDRFDGHKFVADALASGAAGALVSRDVPGAQPLLIAGDTLQALGQLGALHRSSFKGKLVAITGSAGKTTTKEMLASILGERAPVHATRGNFNNEIGVPLTLLQLDDQHHFAVIEMGAAKAGDIQYLVDIANPDVSVITNAKAAHLEGFGDVGQVARTKGEIYIPEPGRVAVINSDDPHSDLWRQLAGPATIVCFSVQGNPEADVRAMRVVPGADTVSFELQTAWGTCPVELHVAGLHNVANALAAAAAALACGVDLADVKHGLESFNGVAGRMQFLPGRRGQVVIDDTYNANPDAVCSAIDVLALQAGKKVLVLGDMAELGVDSAAHHRRVGDYAQQRGIDLLITVGSMAALAAAAFGATARTFADQGALLDYLVQHNGLPGFEVCLVKGSRSAHMERVVQVLVDGEIR
jgi:UDP-N-acetylmuramoyl-tripeptide--D-alanyl-D-alanine ligase